jgi:hypothetical protein
MNGLSSNKSWFGVMSAWESNWFFELTIIPGIAYSYYWHNSWKSWLADKFVSTV